MIGHQAVAVHLPGGLLAGFLNRSDKAPPVQIVQKDPLGMIAPVHHVVNCTRILNAQLAGHCSAQDNLRNRPDVKPKEYTISLTDTLSNRLKTISKFSLAESLIL
jgi:hypothetical protein